MRKLSNKEKRQSRTIRMTDSQFSLLKKKFGGIGKAIDYLCYLITAVKAIKGEKL